MPENEFEKQVQMKMDGLKLRPSEPVWEKIHADLHERKRRRFFIMLSATAAALLLSWFGYSYFHSDNNSKHLQQETAIGKENSTNTNTDKAINDKNSTLDLATQPKASEKETGGAKETTANKVSKDDPASSIQPAIIAADEKASNEKQHLKKIKAATNKNQLTGAGKLNKKNDLLAADLSTQKAADKINNKQNGKTNANVFNAGNDIDAITDNNETENLLTRDNVAVSLDKIKLQNQSINIAENKTPDVSNVLPAIVKSPLKFSTKLKFGLIASGGISSRTKQPFEFTSSAEKSVNFSDVSQNFVQTGNGNPIGGILVLPPSEVKPGAAFKVGVAVEKPLSKSFTISSGLQYAYSSDHITIGKSLSGTPNSSNSLIDRSTVAVAAYGGTPNVEKRNYTNQYHFIELPVIVQYTINKRWKNPFVWNAGASVGRLVSTNALLYDEAYAGIYYDGKNDIKKTQLNLFTGFALQFNVNRLQWSVGPQVAVNTTKLFDNPYDNNLHPVAGAINLRVLFPGKKK